MLREYWPDNKSGEMETLERISEAFRLIGIQAVKVPVSAGEDLAIQNINPLFALDIHYEAPRLSGVFSVGALWNPVDYYTFWGGADTIARQMQHDLFVAANPRVAEAWLRVLAPDYALGVLPFNHTVPSTAIQSPNATATNHVFYAGIGWDRNAAGLQRHEEVFRALEERGVLEIYGPKKIANGLSPWDGFKSYKGELPFDGSALISKINHVKFALALSSLSHLRSEIASNRIFESIAGGAIPIVDKNIDFPFDLSPAIHFDNSKPLGEAIADVSSAMKTIIGQPGEHSERIVQLQSNLKSGFTLDDQLRVIVDRVRDLKSITLGSDQASSQSIENIFEMASRVDPAQCDVDHKVNSNHLSLLLFRYFEEGFLTPNWVSFNSSLEAPIRQVLSGFTPSENVDVAHVSGIWRNGRSGFYLGGDALNPEIRIIDTFIVSGSLLRDWCLETRGIASIGSFLQALAIDSSSQHQTLRHRIVRGNNFKIEASTNPINTEALCSNLDLAVLARVATSNYGVISDLAGKAHQHRMLTQGMARPSPSILAALGRELNSLGLKPLAKLVLQYLWARIRK